MKYEVILVDMITFIVLRLLATQICLHVSTKSAMKSSVAFVVIETESYFNNSKEDNKIANKHKEKILSGST